MLFVVLCPGCVMYIDWPQSLMFYIYIYIHVYLFLFFFSQMF